MSKSTGGEEALIQTYFAPLAKGYPGAFGLRDDCAAIRPEPGTDLIVKTDPIRAGVHFFENDAPDDIAWKALAVNVSDLAAKGARPIGYLLALSFPDAPDAVWLRTFAAGLASAQAAFGCHLVGGDTDKASGPMSVSITVFGDVPAGRMIRRDGAQPGDHLFVSGTIGDAGLGLHARQNDFARRFWPIDANERDFLSQRYLRPQPRLALRDCLLRHASGAKDVSDGLAKDADRMARASGLALTVDSRLVPLSRPAQKIAEQVAEWRLKVLTTGDDYEVLCAVSAERAEAFFAEAGQAGVPVTRIGAFRAGEGTAVMGPDGETVSLDQQGWDHF
jgi:thiamine-monophosphate kinase